MFQKKRKMKMNKMKISDLYPINVILDSTTPKIFDYLSTDETLQDFITAENIDTLNNDYYLSHSNDKYVSPFVKKLFNDGKTSGEISSLVAQICVNRFGVKWKKLYDALMTEYNPLENYSMEETRTPNLTSEDTEETKSDIKTERTTSADSKYKGFNASAPVTITKTDGTEDSETSGAKLDNVAHKVTSNTGTETLTRAGNIGVTTSQQMLESEFKVRQYDFYKQIYNDIDSVLCLSIY